MIVAVFRAMLLAILRDRGAFAMAFVLPPLIYVIFAAIFSVATGGDLRVKIAILDSVKSESSTRLVAALGESKELRVVANSATTESGLEAMVRRSEIDAGLIIRADPADLERRQIPIRLIGDAGRAIAVPIVTGHLLKLFGEYLPDVTYRQSVADLEGQLGGLTPDQKRKRDEVIADLKREAGEAGPKAGSLQDLLVENVMVKPASAANAAVVYYAGAVTFMFLLFAAAQSAMSLIDERESGVVDRVVASTGGVGVLISGKFLFLLMQGVVQSALIFAIASVAYGVNTLDRLPGWTLTTFAAAACAASLGLLVAAACRSRQQAATLSNFMVLVLSAIGGSMVPRFLMPPWLQEISWVTPNAWTIEAYHRLLWQNTPLAEILLPIAVLCGAAVGGLLLATVFLRRAVNGAS